MLARSCFPGLLIALSVSLPVGADVISGKVTDFDSKAALAGVKISSGAAATVSGPDGSYTLNTAVTGLSRRAGLDGIRWDASSSDFRWTPDHGDVSLEVRTFAGALLDRFDSRSAGADAGGHGRYAYRNAAEGIQLVILRSDLGVFHFRMTRVGGSTLARGERTAASPRFLRKAAAVNNLTYAFTGYMDAVQQVTGSKADVNVSLKKGIIASRQARLTWFESYPDPGSEECIKYNGCTWAGQFAALSGKQPESWVKANNILAVHSKDFNTYKLKTLRLTQGSKSIDAKVYDMCSDSDCDGCCTRNAGSTGFLIDVEKYTAERFGARDGTVNWICLDC